MPPCARTADETVARARHRIGVVDAAGTTWDAATFEDGEQVRELRLLLAGRYEIEGLLGVGGMGSVYRARDRELDERVALKVLRRDLVADPATLDRFRREVKLARRVTHRNVARTYDIGEHGAERFLTMELVEGESLAAALSRERTLPVRRVMAIAEAVCEGLAAAHAVGVVHRDLKPDNVLIAKDGRVVITDFGIARAAGDRATRTLGAVVGTPEYMAPEQVEARGDVDGRADVYALGVMMYEMLTGEPAWKAETAFAIAAQRLLRPPPDPRSVCPVPDALAEIVLRCMARSPDARFASAADVAAALRACAGAALDDLPFSLRSTIPPPLVPRTPAGVRTVAVLPVRNTGTPEDAPFAAAFGEALADALAGNPELRVRAPAEATSARDTSTDPRLRGRHLGADVVVTASLRVTAEQAARLVIRVLSVAEGLALWAARIERPLGELFALADDAAASVAQALLASRPPPLPRGSQDAQVVALYARALREATSAARGANDRAIALLERAAERAPDDPWVCSAYASALVRRVEDGDGIVEEALEAKALAERARAASPAAIEPATTLARVQIELGNIAAAAAHARAFDARVAHAPLQRTLGLLLADAGELTAAAEHFGRAARLRPSDDRARWDEARARALAGDYALAEAILDAAPPAPTGAYYQTAVRVAAWRGDRARLEALARSLRARPVPSRDVLLAYVEAALGGAVEPALALLDTESRHAGALPRRRAIWLTLGAEVASIAGDSIHAASFLARADEAMLSDAAWLTRCPLLERTRTSPMVRELAARVAQRAAAARLTPETG